MLHCIRKVLGHKHIFREKFLFKYDRFLLTVIQQFFYMEEELTYTLTADSGNGIYLNTLWFKFFFQLINGAFFPIFCKNTVDFVRCDHLGPGSNFRIIGFQLFIDLVNIINRITSLCGSCIYNMDDYPGTLNMAQEFMAKPHTFRCTLDQPGNICDDKATVFCIYYTQIRSQGGEMIIGNFRLGIGDSGKKGGFSYIWKSYQSNISNYLQFQKDL